MKSMEDLLPSELCTICHAAPPKYRCPRCSIRTCSLPCAKRHKKWAQCSGLRDPTRFIKREDLATPQGIDHDFNFLTSIERTLDRADRDAERRGIEVPYGPDENYMTWSSQRSHHPAKGEEQTKRALEECQVVVQRAPKGMARRKQNLTTWQKKRSTVIWTVEWILNDGTSKIGSCAANSPIAEGYASQFATTAPSEKKKKKRKAPHLSAPSKATDSPRLAPSNSSPHASTSVSASPTSTNPNPPPQLPAISKTPPVASLSSSQEPPPPAPKPLHFYLLHPGTPSPTRVLIPLSPSSKLASSLRHRVVLEFPTIYALRFAPDELPTGFVTEEKYLRDGEQTRISLVEATLHENSVMSQPDDPATSMPECFDAEQLLTVLKRDLDMRCGIWSHR